MVDSDLPPPSETAGKFSSALLARIHSEIDGAGGWLDFERYMERCLYEPGLGYYSGGSVKLGQEGDFVTAAEISPLFGRTLAGTLAGWLMQLEDPVILEVGAGSGELAATILGRLDELDQPPAAYQILEVSADLRARQRIRLRPWGQMVQWLDALPENGFQGVVLANEVVDALPVTRFVKHDGQIFKLGVGRGAEALRWVRGPADAPLDAAVARIELQRGAPLPDGYQSEFCSRLPAWLAALAAPLTRGALLFIDYGLPRREYYHESRYQGTLICHYRHRAHDDPFLWPGLQDLSAWVDFSHLAGAAVDCGLEIAGYTTQAQFLLHGGIADLLGAHNDAAAGLTEAAAVKTLILPGEMGERFKVILLSRDPDGEVFQLPGRDLRNRL